uniref:Uncharacterized protein n=1 Tax=viral metagenome TaxID=1070528 RepID=A0A6C0AEW9_9ZZZZ
MDLSILPIEIIYKIASYNGYKLRNNKLIKQLEVSERIKNFFKNKIINTETYKHITTCELGKIDDFIYVLTIFLNYTGKFVFMLHKNDRHSSVTIGAYEMIEYLKFN